MTNFSLKIKVVRKPISMLGTISTKYSTTSSSFAGIINDVIKKELDYKWLNTLLYIELNSVK